MALDTLGVTLPSTQALFSNLWLGVMIFGSIILVTGVIIFLAWVLMYNVTVQYKLVEEVGDGTARVIKTVKKKGRVSRNKFGGNIFKVRGLKQLILPAPTNDYLGQYGKKKSVILAYDGARYYYVKDAVTMTSAYETVKLNDREWLRTYFKKSADMNLKESFWDKHGTTVTVVGIIFFFLITVIIQQKFFGEGMQSLGGSIQGGMKYFTDQVINSTRIV